MRNCLSLILFLPVLVFGKTTIEGVAPFFAGRSISVNTTQFCMTDQLVELGSAVIDKDGSFFIEFDLKASEVLTFKIELQEIHELVIPFSKYEMSIEPLKNPENLTEPLNYSFEPVSTDPKYADKKLLEDIRFHIGSYYFNSGGVFYYKDWAKWKEETYRQWGAKKPEDAYCQNYIEYHLLGILLLNENYIDTVFSRLTKMPIRYGSCQHFELFKNASISIYSQILSRKSDEWGSSLKQYENYKALSTLLTEKFRGLPEAHLDYFLLLVGQKDMVNHPENREFWMRLFYQIEQQSTIEQSQKLASLVFENNQKLLVGTIPKSFEMVTETNVVDLPHSYRGRYLYFGFINSKSGSDQKKLLLLKKIATDFPDVNVLIILTDRERPDLNGFNEKKLSNLHIAYFAQNFDMLQYYGAFSSVFYLLGENGRVVQAPAPSPDSIFGILKSNLK